MVIRIFFMKRIQKINQSWNMMFGRFQQFQRWQQWQIFYSLRMRIMQQWFINSLNPTYIFVTFHISMRNRFISTIPQLNSIKFGKFRNDFQIFDFRIQFVSQLNNFLLFQSILFFIGRKYINNLVDEMMFSNDINVTLQAIIVFILIQQRRQFVFLQYGFYLFTISCWINYRYFFFGVLIFDFLYGLFILIVFIDV